MPVPAELNNRPVGSIELVPSFTELWYLSWIELTFLQIRTSLI